MRAACLICDDLPTAVTLLKRHDGGLADLEGEELVRDSEIVGDLLRFWVSEEAVAFRRRAGLLPMGVTH